MSEETESNEPIESTTEEVVAPAEGYKPEDYGNDSDGFEGFDEAITGQEQPVIDTPTSDGHDDSSVSKPEPVDDSSHDGDGSSTAEVQPINPSMLSLARQAGIDEGYAAYLNTSGRLAEEIDNRFNAAESEEAPLPASDGSGAAEAQAAEEFKPFELKLSDDIHEDLAEQLTAMSEFVNANAKAAHEAASKYEQQIGEFGGLRNHFEQQEANRLQSQIDSHYDNLGEEFSDFFGEGKTVELTEGSDAAKNRMEVLQTMQRLSRGYNTNESPGMDSILKQAIRLTLGDNQTILARKSISNQLTDQKKTHTARTTQRRSAPATGDGKALQVLQDAIVEMGGRPHVAQDNNTSGSTFDGALDSDY